jgi:phosphoglycolate phosphatase
MTMRAVLFDLDGTLADTGADLAAAVNRQRAERGLATLPVAGLSRLASSGARGLLKAGFGMLPEHPDYEAYRVEFLNYYAAALCVHTTLFPGIETLLKTLAQQGVPWGIVTNKAVRFTAPLVDLLAARYPVFGSAACVVSGDTAARAKPFPDPLLHALQALDRAPHDCIYVGDDLRDIQAAHAAGMPAIAVRWGYLGDGAPPEAWRAEWVIDAPAEIIAILGGLVGATTEPSSVE